MQTLQLPDIRHLPSKPTELVRHGAHQRKRQAIGKGNLSKKEDVLQHARENSEAIRNKCNKTWRGNAHPQHQSSFAIHQPAVAITEGILLPGRCQSSLLDTSGA